MAAREVTESLLMSPWTLPRPCDRARPGGPLKDWHASAAQRNKWSHAHESCALAQKVHCAHGPSRAYREGGLLEPRAQKQHERLGMAAVAGIERRGKPKGADEPADAEVDGLPARDVVDVAE